MAIKALKQNFSISEMQKMIHQWKAKGVTDSAILKLLDLYLGLTPYMTADGIYPIRNLYQICQSMKTTHTSTLLENIRKCSSFGLIWNEDHTGLLGFYSPLWFQGVKRDTLETCVSVTGFAAPVAGPASEVANPATTDDSILYNTNNNYPSEYSRKGASSENAKENLHETQAENPSEVAVQTPAGSDTPATSPAKEFFHLINAQPEEKKRILVPLIDCIATRQNYTRPRALEAVVILVNEILIPYFDSQPRFAKTSHTGRTIWLQNLMKTRHGDTLLQQAVQKLSKTLQEGLEKQRKKRREFRPVSPFEWKDTDKDARYYDDPIDGKTEIPKEAPPRPSDNAIWNVLSKEWVDISG